MTKLYIAEYAGLAQSLSGEDAVGIVPCPPLAEGLLNSAATTGQIATLGAITAGTLYTNGTYLNVPLTGGTGSGATANITVSGGGVTAVTLVSRGQGYTAADSLSAAAANIGGTGSGFSIPVSTITQQYTIQNPATIFVELSCDGICSVAYGADPVATTSNQRLNAERVIRRIQAPTGPVTVGAFGVQNPGTTPFKISVVTNT